VSHSIANDGIPHGQALGAKQCRKIYGTACQTCDQAIPHGTASGGMGWRCPCEACRAAATTYRQAYHRAHADHIRRKAGQWREDNLERSRAQRRITYLANQEKNQQYTIKWMKDHPEEARAQRRIKRARRHRAYLRQYRYTIEMIIERDGLSCALGGHALDRRDVTVDHIIPLAAGGWDAFWNVQLACVSCNSGKKHRGDRQAQEIAVLRLQELMDIQHPLYRAAA
jgi:5-methylcytosine-specific restriction endonuclease McrA